MAKDSLTSIQEELSSKTKRRTKGSEPEPPKQTAQRFTVNLPVGVIERARDASFWSPGLTLSALVGEALSREITRLEKKRGEPFEKRTGKLAAGRPVKG